MFFNVLAKRATDKDVRRLGRGGMKEKILKVEANIRK